MYNNIKSEQHFPVTSGKRVGVFQASLKLVRAEVTDQLSNKNNKHQNVYIKKDVVNKIKH